MAPLLAGWLAIASVAAQGEGPPATTAEAAERELHADGGAGETSTAAVTTLRAVLARWRTEAAPAREPARELVVATAALADFGDEAALEFVPEAIALCERHGFGDRSSQLWTCRLQHLASTAPDELLAAAGAAFAAIEKLAPTVRQWAREGITARVVVEVACSRWRLPAADAAVAFLRRSCDVAAPIDPAMARVLQVLHDSARARLSLLRGEPERALRNLAAVESALAREPLQEPFADAYLRALTPLDRVRYQLGNDQVAAAVTATEKMLAELETTDPHQDHQKSLLRLANGTARLLAGDPDGAEAVLRALLQAEELAPDVRLRALERLGRLALQRGDSKALTMALDEAGTADEAEVDVRAALAGLRVQALRRAGKVDIAHAGRLRLVLRACQQELLQRADEQPREFGGIGFLHFEDAHQVLADLVDATLLAEPEGGVEHAFAHVLEVQARGSLSRLLKAPDDLASIRAVLPERGGFVVHVPSRYGSHLFFGDRATLRHERLSDRDSVERVAREFGASLLGDTNPERLWQLAATARERLLPKPVLAAIAAWDSVCISGTETLGQMPFEALRLDDDRLLGEAKAVTNQTSLPLGVVLARRRAALSTPRRLLLVAELAPPAQTLARLGEKAGALPQDATLALRQPFAEAEVAAADARTPDGLAALDLTAFDVIHLLAHGIADPTRAFGHGLCLGADAAHADGVLWPEQVLSWRVRGLVILSACQGGRAPRRVGEDHASNLGGAFLFAGAAGVVQSRARLQTDATLRLSAELHRALATGATYAEALRVARASCRAEGLAARFHAAQVQLLGP